MSKEKLHYSVILIVSLFIFHLTYGLRTLDPTNINWLMSAYHDWGQHYLGWSFFRYESWTFPLGTIENYNYPNGTNIGFTDSIPLVALLLKPFSSFLPDDFQYFGIWLLSCYFMLGIYSFKVFRVLNIKPLYSLLATVIVIANPVLVFRGIHPALCAQWLIVASFYYFLRNSKSNNAVSININQISLLAISALVTPYLTAMIAVFNVILPIKNYFFDKSLSKKLLCFFPIISFLIVLVIWYLLGMIGIQESINLASSDAYNLMSFNLNSFYNSYGYFSEFLPKFEMLSDKQYEGFAYLGLGMILLTLIAITFFVIRVLKKKDTIKKIKKKYLLLFGAGFFLMLFAMTNQVSLNQKVLFEYPLPGFVEKLYYTFRATGRFIWVMYYLIFIFSFVIFYKIKLNNSIRYAIVIVLIGIQFYDTQNLLFSKPSKNIQINEFKTKLSEEKWLEIFRQFDEIITYPPFNVSLSTPLDYQDFCFLALKAKKPITNGYVARIDAIKSQNYINALSQQLRNATIKENQLFITTSQYIENFNVLMVKDKIRLKKIDDYILIYSKSKDLKFEFPESTADRTMLDELMKNSKPKEMNISKGSLKETDDIKFYVENFNFENNVIQVEGWAFLKNSTNNSKDSLFVTLGKNDEYYKLPTKMFQRTDITNTYKTGNLDNSGFKTLMMTDNFKPANYTVWIAIKNDKGDFRYSKTDKTVEIKN